MKFCRHDWHVHKSGKQSKRYKCLISDGGVGGLIWLASSGAVCVSSIIITLSFCDTKDQALGGVIFSLLLCLAYLCIYGGRADAISEKNDPWKAKDKSCTKCNKIVLDATKEKEKNEKHSAILLEKSAKREVITVKLDERYAKWITRREKAK